MEVERPIYLKRLIDRMDNGSAKVVTGVRRCGKSYLLNKIFRGYLLSNGVPEERVVTVALDDVRDEEYLDPRRLYDRLAAAAAKGHTYAIIDEIQLIEDFVPLVNGLLRLDDLDLYVTWSNSRLLSTDVLTEFRGRGDEVHMRPFSFSEFASAHPGDSRAMRDYLLYGGMPELLTRSDHEQKASYLQNLVAKVYLDDVVERHGVRLRDNLDRIFDDLCSSVGSLTNPSKIARTLHSAKGSGIDDNTVRDYLAHLEDAFLFDAAKRYDVRGKRYFQSLAKYYACDVGVRNARLNYRQLDENHLMENIVYAELRARGLSVDVGMVRSREQRGGKRVERQLEVDFIATRGSSRWYVQVAQGIDYPGKEEQEKKPLIKVNDSFRKVLVIRDALIPAHDESGILVIGLEDFLLDQGSLDL